MCAFILMGLPEVAINHVLQLEFQLKVSEILSHHNQGWPKNLNFSYCFVCWKGLGIMLWRFYKNIMDRVGITAYWFETIFIFLTQNTV